MYSRVAVSNVLPSIYQSRILQPTIALLFLFVASLYI